MPRTAALASTGDTLDFTHTGVHPQHAYCGGVSARGLYMDLSSRTNVSLGLPEAATRSVVPVLTLGFDRRGAGVGVALVAPWAPQSLVPGTPLTD